MRSLPLCFLVLWALALQHPARAEVCRYGIIAPLSGPLADIGETMRRSVLLADDAYDTDKSCEFIVEDDQFNPKATVSAFRKLADVDGVRAIISFGSSTSLSISELAERAKLPLFTIGISDKMTEGRHYVFRHFPTAQNQHAAIRAEMQRRGYKSIAIVTLSQDAMLNMRELMVADSPAEIVFSEEVNPGDSDFKSIALRIRAKNPDAVYLLVLPPHVSVLAKQLRDLGYRGEFFGAAHLQSDTEVTAAHGALENAWFATADDGPSAKFRERYFARFQEHPYPDGTHAYDLAKILIETKDARDIASVLNARDSFDGIFGHYLLGDKNTFQLPVVLKVINKERFVALNKAAN